VNFFTILSQLEEVDPEVYDRLDSRRAVFKHMSGLGQKLTAAALPLAIGAVFNKAYAQTPVSATVANVLNFALKLEYLESYFYQQRTALTGLSARHTTALAQIATDETKHISFLRTTIASLGATPIADPTPATFDYSAAGRFADWRTNPATYLALAQSFEDLGVRAYKGAAPLPAVMANKTVLTAALSIHAVEARHASHLREMRRAGVASTTPSQGIPVSPYNVAPKSWISGIDNGGAVPSITIPIYGAGNNTNAPNNVTFPAEDNVTHGGITLSTSTSASFANLPASAFSEAFDEGLDVGTVSAIAKLFVIPSSTLFN
jgi:hypothetical protein